MAYNKKNRFQNEHKFLYATGLEPVAWNYRDSLVPLLGHSVWIEGILDCVQYKRYGRYVFLDYVLCNVKIVKVAAYVRNYVDWQNIELDHLHVFMSIDAPVLEISCYVRVKGICREYLRSDGKRNIGVNAFTMRERKVF